MRTLEDSDYRGGLNLTGQQLVFLNALTDRKWAQKESEEWAPLADKWYDRSEIRKKMGLKIFNPSILSERIITPLESAGIVEQMELPVKEGWKKMKKVVRIRKNVDKRLLHELVIRSALNSMRKRTGDESTTKIYEGMYKKSWKVLDYLEKIEKERVDNEEAEYWKERLQYVDYQDWRELIKIEKRIHETLKQVGQRCCESGICSAEKCPMLKLPGMAFIIAGVVRDWSELSRQMASFPEEPDHKM